jgi:hypothetical protein
VRWDRRRDPEHRHVIPCRECAEPLDLDPARIERIAGRAFIECPSCANLIWVRRTDVRQAARSAGSVHDRSPEQ